MTDDSYDLTRHLDDQVHPVRAPLQVLDDVGTGWPGAKWFQRTQILRAGLCAVGDPKAKSLLGATYR